MSEMGGLTRRDVLRRGAALGGAVLWATPTVQTLGMGRAFAAEPSGPCVVYCVKYEVDEGTWTGLGKGTGNCFVCPSGAIDGVPPGIGAATVVGSADTGFTVTLPPGCSVVDTAESGTPDDFTGRSGVWAKCGSQHQDDEACHFQPVDPGATSFRVEVCSNGKGISHFELAITCCPQL